MEERDPTFFYVDLWSRLLELQLHEEAEATGTTNDRKKQPMTSELRPSTGAAGGRDAHWADPTSLELLDLIVERAPSMPLLAIVTFRPEFAAPWIGRSGVTLISLNLLPRGLRAEMIAQITGLKRALWENAGAVIELLRQATLVLPPARRPRCRVCSSSPADAPIPRSAPA